MAKFMLKNQKLRYEVEKSEVKQQFEKSGFNLDLDEDDD